MPPATRISPAARRTSAASHHLPRSGGGASTALGWDGTTRAAGSSCPDGVARMEAADELGRAGIPGRGGRPRLRSLICPARSGGGTGQPRGCGQSCGRAGSLGSMGAAGPSRRDRATGHGASFHGGGSPGGGTTGSPGFASWARRDGVVGHEDESSARTGWKGIRLQIGGSGREALMLPPVCHRCRPSPHVPGRQRLQQHN